MVFWSDRFWLPSNLTWDDLNKSNVNYSQAWQTLIPIPLGIFLLFVRYVIEKNVFAPLGKLLGIKDERPERPPYIETLERQYNKNRRLHVGMSLKLSKQTDMSENEIERWWLQRRAQDKPTILGKFSETSFKGLCYTINFYFGLYTIWNKTYLWNTSEWWRDFPHHSLDSDLHLLYFMVLTFYWSLLFAHFTEPRRLDFYQMLLHHVLTISLINITFIANYHKFFHFVIVLHDVVEYLLHIIKALKYAKFERSATILYIIFVILWTPTRLYICPTYVLYPLIFEAPKYFVISHIHRILIGLFIILQGLHIFWTYLIYKVLIVAIKGNSIEEAEDIRSDDEDETPDDKMEKMD
uniref:CSON014200 protein n=1 Tax=Culicoides sonorensis TaxID=179676 RepID=A0A336M9V8_CULSO